MVDSYEKIEEQTAVEYQLSFYGGQSEHKRYYFTSVSLAQKYAREIHNGGHELEWIQIDGGDWLSPKSTTSGWKIHPVTKVTGLQVVLYTRSKDIRALPTDFDRSVKEVITA